MSPEMFQLKSKMPTQIVDSNEMCGWLEKKIPIMCERNEMNERLRTPSENVSNENKGAYLSRGIYRI